MIYKTRGVPGELVLLRHLNTRMNFSEGEMTYYLNLEKGFAGEMEFDLLVQSLVSHDCLILNDLLFEVNNTLFQIDTLMIGKEVIYNFNVKNFEGDFYLDGEKWLTLARSEITNPFLQLKRSESLLRRLLRELSYNLEVESYLVFINPEFHLYQSPMNQPIVYPAQVKRFLVNMNKKVGRLSDKHTKLAERLLSLHISKSPNARTHSYEYDQLRKGIVCDECGCIIEEFRGKTISCKKCGHKENYISSVLRNVDEFCLLFADKRITTNEIYDWCGFLLAKKTIRNVLYSNFEKINHGNATYYIKKNS